MANLVHEQLHRSSGIHRNTLVYCPTSTTSRCSNDHLYARTNAFTSLLTLCSVTIVHRFASPEWLRVLHKHLAGAAEQPFSAQAQSDTVNPQSESLFDQIVAILLGEALLFSPSAIVRASLCDDGHVTFHRRRYEQLRVKIRSRLTSDGGRSVLSL